MYYHLLWCSFFFFFKQKTAYERRISDWSSDVALPISAAAARPSPAFIQNSPETCPWVTSSRCTVAVDRPRSLNCSSRIMTTATMATRPKASGASRRASTATDANCRRVFAACASIVTAPPRSDRVPRPLLRCRTESGSAGSGAAGSDCGMLRDPDLVRVCEEPLVGLAPAAPQLDPGRPADRKSVVSGKSVSVRVDLGGRRIVKKKNNNKLQQK